MGKRAVVGPTKKMETLKNYEQELQQHYQKLQSYYG